MPDAQILKQAIKVIKKRYGKPCKEYAHRCFVCEAYVAVSILEDMIDTIKWAKKQTG